MICLKQNWNILGRRPASVQHENCMMEDILWIMLVASLWTVSLSIQNTISSVCKTHISTVLYLLGLRDLSLFSLLLSFSSLSLLSLSSSCFFIDANFSCSICRPSFQSKHSWTFEITKQTEEDFAPLRNTNAINRFMKSMSAFQQDYSCWKLIPNSWIKENSCFPVYLKKK